MDFTPKFKYILSHKNQLSSMELAFLRKIDARHLESYEKIIDKIYAALVSRQKSITKQ